MTYYTYRQNNSGGSFVSPAMNVVIKAETPEQADTIAIANGIYFDDNYEIDCSCCGTRWDRAGDWMASDVVPDVSENVFRMSNWDNITPQIVIEQMSAVSITIRTTNKGHTMNNGYTYDEQFDTADNTCPDCDKVYSQCDCD